MRSQVLQPPYIYRWAVLISVTVIVVVLVLQAFRSDPDVADKAHAEPRPAPEKRPDPVSANLIRELPTDDRVVALTFDDGPHPEHTPQVLDLLAEHHAVATFCMVGAQARRRPDLVRDVVDAGMRLCNHTVDHDERLSRRPAPAIENALTDAGEDLRAAAGDHVPVGYFRAPGGNWSLPLEQMAAHQGMRPLGWSVDTRDWSRPGVAAIVATVERGVRPGSVILMHDGGGQRDQTVAALGRLLPWLTDRGYRFDFPS
ncbi:polysaccharide deacetylase family protein [Actinophytocola sp.]|uniref:polysaccharide deacetylase family protein n=1 Tax=Actinophytocola sp. TaxID=1872138 RepID=UPI003D6A8D8D